MQANKCRWIRKCITALSAVVMMTVMLLTPMKIVHADPESPLVVVESYSVSGEKIVPGENFTLTIVLRNHNMFVPAEEVIFNVDYPSGVAPAYGTTSQTYIGTIGAGKSVEFSLDFTSLNTMNKDTVDFYFGIYGYRLSTSAKATIPCGSDVPISILSSTIPHSVVLTDGINTSVTFKVLGTENISNVTVDVLVNGVVAETGHIGIMTAGVTKTQGISVGVYETGEYLVEMQIHYTDQSGKDSVINVDDETVSVVESAEQLPVKNDTNQSPADEDNTGTDNMLIMGVSAILIVLIVFVIVYMITRKRR